jgi:hypothetical protein
VKIGVVYIAWQSEDLLTASLQPWIEARATRLGGNDFVICAVSVPFEGFPQEEKRDKTQALLAAKHDLGYIDQVIMGETPLAETEARSRALDWLKTQSVTEVIQVDADEIYATSDISSIFTFVAKRPEIAWFRLCLKNYVGINGDGKTYLVEPFTPPRIHRINLQGGFTAYGFYNDNDICYTGGITRNVKRQDQFPSMTIPKSVVFVPHYSWPASERSHRKIRYQIEGRKWPSCSFSWDDTKGLIFNEAHVRALGQPLPETAQDE